MACQKKARNIRVSIDKETGLLATPECKQVMVEDFIMGTQPQKYCTHRAADINKFFAMDLDQDQPEAEENKPSENQQLSFD